jgi:nitroreductase
MKYNLSEITDIIRNRRTIYPEDYTDRKVQREIVEKLLNNAIWAPTHGMTQPWRFKVFMDDAIARLATTMQHLYRETTAPEKFKPAKAERLYNRVLKTSVIIAVCMERQEEEKIPEIEEVEAVACAVQNMHLTCTAYGLGAYWSSGGATYTNEMKEFLGLKNKDRCLGFFFVGYPSGVWPSGHRKPVEYVTEWITK